MFVARDLIYCKVFGCPKKKDLKRGVNFPFFLSLFFILVFYNHLKQKQFPFSCIGLDIHDNHVFQALAPWLLL
jgi:hypothetical protein